MTLTALTLTALTLTVIALTRSIPIASFAIAASAPPLVFRTRCAGPNTSANTPIFLHPAEKTCLYLRQHLKFSIIFMNTKPIKGDVFRILDRLTCRYYPFHEGLLTQHAHRRGAISGRKRASCR
ncbi:MAG: hypothetical protein P8L46_14175 [Acidimicrobiales bacterium]|nr:hypothetical protein [Acidimicrobiales bacterium]